MADTTGQDIGAMLRRQDSVLLIGAIGLLVLALLIALFTQAAQNRGRLWLETVRSIPESAARIARASGEISRGVAPDLQVIGTLTAAVDEQTLGLIQGNEINDLPAMPSSMQDDAAALRAAWGQLQAPSDRIIGLRPEFDTGLTEARGLAEMVRGPEGLYAMHLELAQRLVGQRANAVASLLVAQQLVGLDRLAGAASRLFSEGQATRERYEQMVALVNDIQSRHAQMLGEPATRALAELVAPDLVALTTTVDGLRPRVDAAVMLQALAADLPKAVPGVTRTAGVLAGQLEQREAQLAFYPVISAIAVALAIALLVAYGLIATRGMTKRLVAAETNDAQRQQAILGLLDEITNLADGDLTVDVTVTEDFTGAIADSLNYTVENMRALVGTINQTSERVAAGATATQQLAQDMSAGSERQASDIASLTLQMTETAATLSGVAERAESVADQAEESVDVARGGAETARGTINVMAALREQIQDTSKRIKRLGESSQEIGNIIELINDISEQTGTLALNAAIQAAMAGEQGRGFAVVAEEVQRLAERASTATRQVETLVKTIQADTNEAIVSMERSTHNVVNGARSAEEAGGALSRVQLSSQTMAELIAGIAGAARRQSASTTDAAQRMQAVREISTQTSRASAETARAVAELSSLSAQLRQSVAGFKLPEGS